MCFSLHPILQMMNQGTLKSAFVAEGYPEAAVGLYKLWNVSRQNVNWWWGHGKRRRGGRSER